MQLFHRKYGEEGFPIVILHGLYGSSDNWVTIARKLSDNNQVYLIDIRNHGQSPHSSIHTYKSMVEDLIEFFEQEGLQKATILGHSMGGKVAMLFAADYPEYVHKLIIADICPKDYTSLGNNSQIVEHRKILRVLIELKPILNSFENRKELLSHLQNELKNEALTMFLSKSISFNQKTKSFHLLINAPVLNHFLNELISSVNISDFEHRLPILNYPILFIRGLNSNYITNDDICIISKIYPEAKISGIPNAGHWLHAEQPLLFIQTVQQFI